MPAEFPTAYDVKGSEQIPPDPLGRSAAAFWQNRLGAPDPALSEGKEAKRYNVQQKLTYLILIAVLLPLQILADRKIGIDFVHLFGDFPTIHLSVQADVGY